MRSFSRPGLGWPRVFYVLRGQLSALGCCGCSAIHYNEVCAPEWMAGTKLPSSWPLHRPANLFSDPSPILAAGDTETWPVVVGQGSQTLVHLGSDGRMWRSPSLACPSWLKAASTANYDPHVFAKNKHTWTHGCSHILGVCGMVGGGDKGHATRRAGQVFRLHFEMFPARTLRSVSPSALRVYIWQRMQGPRTHNPFLPQGSCPSLSPPFLAWALFAVCLLHFYCVLVCRGSSAK